MVQRKETDTASGMSLHKQLNLNKCCVRKCLNMSQHVSTNTNVPSGTEFSQSFMVISLAEKCWSLANKMKAGLCYLNYIFSTTQTTVVM